MGSIAVVDNGKLRRPLRLCTELFTGFGNGCNMRNLNLKNDFLGLITAYRAVQNIHLH
jgi:hypothetical protein